MSAVSQRASLIRCESLSIQYAGGPRAVDDVDLEVRAGEIVSLIGPSGCGKTTLLRLMAGLESPTSGTVRMDPPIHSNPGGIAFVFQQPTLLPWRTALQNVMLPLELIAREQRTNQQPVSGGLTLAKESLEKLGLADAVHRYPRQLSGGMKMRVSLARALVTEPSILLLDEPFAALDDMLRNQLGELVLGLWEQQRFTAVMVTHNIAESILFSHRIAVMRHGRLMQVLDNPLPWPRDESLRASPEFGLFYGRVSAALRGET